ncbi:MAG: glutathione-disulfide reductase [Beijerinckiaceae bacterium]|nr:glutathione-disulfide reductase [Beijerinckiaceae bacterium]
MAAYDCDLFVIGGGSGGVRAARIAAGYGARVKLAEESRMGGTCVIRGCVPKKLYVYASRFAQDFEDSAGFGWAVKGTQFNFSQLKAAKDKEIARLENAYKGNLERVGVETIAARATITSPNTVRLSDGRDISAKYILVATGGRPFLPEAVPGIHLADNSDDFFEWNDLPASVIVVGSGYIGVEFACLLNRLGVKTTLIFRSPKPLPSFDEDLRDHLVKALEAQGIAIKANHEIARIDGHHGALSATLKDNTSLAAERIIYASGRVPNTKGLGLENAGVVTGKRGEIPVDELSQTITPSIYAVGDVTDRIALTPVAIREGHAFADTVFGGKRIAVAHGAVPTAVFTTPEIGTAGLTEAQARSAYKKITIYKTDFRPMKATLAGSTERTFMKLIVDGETDRVLGVHILGEAAGEMIQLVGIALHMGATKTDFDATMAVHPTAAEELVTMRTPFSVD